MFSHCNLAVLILVLALHDQGETIFGGHEVVPHSRPYMVLLELHKSDGRKTQCDGFLVNEDFVMTAAICKAKSYKVFLGLHDYRKQNGVQLVTVPETNAFPQKAYNVFNHRNDIMLLKLSTKAKVTENVKPIALAGREDGSVPKSCVVPGWGKTEKGGVSDILLEVNVTLTDNEICTKLNKYCSEGESGPSNGDAGGPLVCEDGKAYGVVSASSAIPGGSTIFSYTKIPDNRDWIDYFMEQAPEIMEHEFLFCFF